MLDKPFKFNMSARLTLSLGYVREYQWNPNNRTVSWLDARGEGAAMYKYHEAEAQLKQGNWVPL